MSEFKSIPMVPHTAAKHVLLRRYLNCWFPILGKHNTRLNYIDGFAGPGEYQNGEVGSPIIAVESAVAHVMNGTLPKNVVINFVFVERKPQHAIHLRNCLERVEVPDRFNISVIDGEFAEQMNGILDKLDAKQALIAPTFVLADPFGFSGIPFDLMRRILSLPKCEVFINVMVDFINRFLKHPNGRVESHFPTTFGTEEVLDIPNRSGDRKQQILALYRSQLKDVAKFVGRFDMHGKKDRKTYSLFFASNSAIGFEKMKEAMWSVDKVSGSKFSDADPFGSQGFLFQSMCIESLWNDMLTQFGGKVVTMTEVIGFVVEQTDFLPKHARKLLKSHEKSGDISVIPLKGYKRRAGSFTAGKVEIAFPDDQN